jgi:ABC-type multidrug transport system fused ATPase/permease subunit
MISFIRKFFEPSLLNKKASAKLLLESTWEGIWFDVLPLFSIPILISLLEKKDFTEVVNFSIIVVSLYLVIWSIHFFIRKWNLSAKYIFNYELDKKYRETLLLKDNLELDKIGTGKMQSVLQRGMYAWAESNWQILGQIPKTILGIFSGFYIIFSFGFIYSIIFLLILILSTSGYIYFRKIKLKYDENIEDLENEKNSNSVRLIMSRIEIMFSNQTRNEALGIAGLSVKQKNKELISAKYEFLSDLCISSLGVLMPFLGIIFLLNSQTPEGLNTVLLVSFVYFSSRFSSTMYNSLWIARQMIDHYPQIKKLWFFLDKVPEFKYYNRGSSFAHSRGEVFLKNVSFTYGDTKNVEEEDLENVDKDISKLGSKDKVTILENFDLFIKGGTSVALIGRSGSGKTTIAKLISGYMRPSSGAVVVDGQNLKNIALKSYYKFVGYLTQEPMIFDGTVKENLLYGVSFEKLKNVTDKDLWTALDLAECGFLRKNKLGLKAQVGEKGSNFSGGERQRLAIAKLLLKDPKIIILDEPTSALDSFSEELVTKALNQLFINRTVIIIAHRLKTIKKADRILVLENGKIVEDGKHEELISQNGLYKEMLDLQMGFSE